MKINTSNLDSNLQWSVAICLILVTCIFIFPPEYLLAKQFSKYAVHWMFLCLIIGIACMFLNLENLLFTSFGCSGILATLLLYSYNSSINLADEKIKESISIEFINPTISTDDFDKTFSLLLRQDPDVLVLEEVTPEWRWITEELSEKYKFSVVLSRVDPFGKAIFSKFKFEQIDTLEYKNNPIIIANARVNDNKIIQISAANALPSITMTDFNKLNLYLEKLSKVILSNKLPLILSANFNLVPWSKELRDFKLQTDLNSSRRDNNDGSALKTIWSFFNIPKNEIFYSKELECSEFKEIYDSNLNTIGLFGRYQFKRVN
ncbi:MAG: endonuclease/exonuclease/phosphatase family protein [Saprospiraceae bacterium]